MAGINDGPLLSVEREDRFTRISSRVLSPAFVNSIRRVLVSNIETIGFEEYIHPDDFPLINREIRLPVPLSHERHTVLDNNTLFSIPVISHRLSRLPVYTSEETRELLLTDRVFFAIGDAEDWRKPLCNSGAADIFIHARDMQPVVFRALSAKDRALSAKEQDDDNDPEEQQEQEYVYDSAASKRIRDRISEIFPLNTFIISVPYGGRIHSIVRPIIGVGLDNPRWSPCVQRYRFNRDPEWKTGIQFHKTEGEMGLRKQFSTIPPERCERLGLPIGSTYDRFSKPYEVELLVIKNGKMCKDEAIRKAIQVLRDSLARFQTIYNDSPVHEGGDMEDSVVIDKSLIYKEQNLEMRTVYIPLNTHTEIADSDRIFTGHTIGNLIVSAMLRIIDREVIRDRIELYQKILIAYKVPHQLVQQCVLTVRLPDEIRADLVRLDKSLTNMDPRDILINLAINELQKQLKECLHLLK